MRQYMKQTILPISLYILLQPTYSFAVTIEELTPYRAIYDLSLNEANQKSGVLGLSGRMVYEFSGNKCEGFTTTFRLVNNIDFNELPQRLSDQQVTTVESYDGKKFDFSNKSFANKELTKEVIGNAAINHDNLKVNIIKPEANSYNLEKAVFPSQHTIEIIKNALNKNYNFHINIFDGSEDGNKVIPSNIVIGKPITSQIDDETKIMGKLGEKPAWPINIAYYDDSTNPNGLPVYSTSFLLYENGITRDIIMNYGDFSIKGKLVKLEVPAKKIQECNTNSK